MTYIVVVAPTPPPRPGSPRGPVPPPRPTTTGPIVGRRPPIKAESGSLRNSFILLIVVTLIALLMTPMSLSVGEVTVRMWVGALVGLFGCTIAFGLFRFVSDQRYATDTFYEWNSFISRERTAKLATAIGWSVGILNCYFIAYEIARSYQ